MANNPPGAARAPTDRPERRGIGGLGCDPRIAHLVGSAQHDEVPHRLDKANAISASKSVAIEQRSHLPRARLRRSKAFPLRNVIVEKLSIEPAGLRQFDEGIDRPGLLPIDEGDGLSVASNDVPRSRIAMPDTDRIAESSSEPRSPHRIPRRNEG